MNWVPIVIAPPILILVGVMSGPAAGIAFGLAGLAMVTLSEIYGLRLHFNVSLRRLIDVAARRVFPNPQSI